MLGRIRRTFDAGELKRLSGFGLAVLALHALGWGLLVVTAAGHPAFLALGGIAYMFGLRHAFDADHIAAIDNTTRKLLADRRKPVGVGFFFSLGHSTVVFVIALLLGIAVQAVVRGVVDQHGQLRSIGGLVGTSVSGIFLLVIGILNLLVLLDILRTWARMKRGDYDRDSLAHELTAGGLMARIFGRLFKVVTESWHMYPIGILFGLGFDTASEVALLAITAGSAAQGLPFTAIVALPLIFAAGMSLFDTLDGAFMSKAYRWAFSNPVRKVFYNMTVTGLSVFVAVFVGGIELIQLLIMQLGLRGQPWDAMAGLDWSSVGFIIVGAFVAAWAISFLVYKVRRIDERWGALLETS